MKWKTKKLEEVADFCLGKMLDQKKNKGGLLPYLANVNVRWGEFDLSDLRKMPFQHDELDRYGLKNGDIVMCEGGEPGRCALWKNQHEAMMIQKAIHRIRPKNNLDNKFLYYTFLLKGKTNGFSHLLTGATIKHLPREKLAKLEIPIPEIKIQRQIVGILSSYDDLIENNRRRIQLLEDSARLLYQEWFVHLRFPGFEEVEVADGVPKGWRKSQLGNICSDSRQMILPIQLDSNTPYIGLEHMPRRSISLNQWGVADDVSSSKLKFSSGDIIFGKIRPYFHKVGIAFIDGVTSSDAFVIKPKHEIFKAFTLLTVSSDKFIAFTAQTMKEGSKMPRADWKQMKAYEIMTPDCDALQKFDDLVVPILNQLRNLSLSNIKLARARDLLLPRLMNGEIEV